MTLTEPPVPPMPPEPAAAPALPPEPAGLGTRGSPPAALPATATLPLPPPPPVPPVTRGVSPPESLQLASARPNGRPSDKNCLVDERRDQKCVLDMRRFRCSSASTKLNPKVSSFRPAPRATD